MHFLYFLMPHHYNENKNNEIKKNDFHFVVLHKIFVTTLIVKERLLTHKVFLVYECNMFIL
ncbi:hypothetical protein [Klebsiella pneumoniae IS53]|nr:hypothetical protein [Klebsiella pneumoniae IS53]